MFSKQYENEIQKMNQQAIQANEEEQWTRNIRRRQVDDTRTTLCSVNFKIPSIFHRHGFDK